MRLEYRKILTSKKVGLAVLMILVIYVIVMPNTRKEVRAHSYVLLNKIQGFISEKTSRRTTAGRYETTSMTKTNHQDKMTMKITKATTKMTTKNTPKKTTTKIFTVTPFKHLRTRKITMPFQTTTMVAGRNKTTLTTKIDHQMDSKAKITSTKTAKTTKTKTPKKTTMKILTITPSKTSWVSHQNSNTSTFHPKMTARSRHFICPNLKGRFGNLMFQYAAAYGIAHSKGMDVIISENSPLAKIFHLERGGRVVKDTSMCNGVPKIPEGRASAFDKETLDFSNDKNHALQGYLQSYKYFEKASDEIRSQFTFRDSIKIKAQKVIRGILQQHLQRHNNKSQNWTFVAVHVRRGDMVNHRHGYMVAPKEYFHRTQNMFRALYEHILFVVCSDDIKWSKDNLQSNHTYFVEGNSPEVDMAILSSCNHTISSVGSFSWWSAWLAKGLVTYYCPPARPGSALRTQYSKDFIGLAVLMILGLVYMIVMLNMREKVGTQSYVLLTKIQGFISEKTSRRTTAGRYETTSMTKTNHQDKMTMKITKATTKMTTKNTPKKTTTKIFTITPSKDSRTMNVTMPFQTTTMVAGRNKTTLAKEKSHSKHTTTIKVSKAKIASTKIPKRTTMKILTITPSRNSLVSKTSTVYTKTTAPSKHFICLNLMGRLGNLMFQYAAAYGIAHSKGMDVIISEKEHIVKIFHLERGGRVVKDTSMCNGVPKIPEGRASAFDKETLDFSNDKNHALQGYLQSYKYFEKASDEIRSQFTFRDSIKIKAEKVIRGILQQHLQRHNNKSHNWTFVAVHVRRGDMVNHRHGYMVAPKEYFHRTQNMFRALYDHILFVVCSDDIKWSKDNLQSNHTYFVEGNSPEVDMAILSSCNHTISSVGSFSWWSAWLAKGLVTYYCPPARPGSGLRRAYSKDFNDYFPSKWIRVKL